MRKILIAGSSSGIGRAIAERLLMEDYFVIGLAREHAKFNPDSSSYQTYAVDFSQIKRLEQNLKEIQKKESPVEAIICSIGYGQFVELEQFSIEAMQQLLTVNFLSQAILIKTFIAQFKKRQSGKIILIGSECALEGQKKGSMYCASKFALRGFAQSLRKECANANVAVTVINPGFVDTPFFDNLSFCPADGILHAIQPEQIANTVAMLLAEKNNCVFEEINLQPLKRVIQSKTL